MRRKQRLWRWLASGLLAAVLLGALGLLSAWPGGQLPAPAAAPAPNAARPDFAALYDDIWQTVNDRFFDPNFNGVDWAAIKEKYRAAAQSPDREAFAVTVNQMLAELNTSHTRYFIPEEPAYYQLMGVFLRNNSELQEAVEPFLPSGKPEYSGIGIFTQTIDSQIFIHAILDGSPAEAAGLQTGDRILSVENQPFHPINSFLGKENQPVEIQIQRSNAGSPETIEVTPKRLNGITMFLDAMDASVDVIEQADRKIGYIHVWSYAGDQYQDKLIEELLSGRLKDADALVWDLRDGWGGASPEYLNIFNTNTIELSLSGRNRSPNRLQSAWSKPVVMLVNEGSRSGKEILAYGFRKHQLGPIVGSQTAGAVVAGTLFLMDDGSFLYLAVADVKLDSAGTSDGLRLEGVGVTPDVIVPAALPYSQGADLQKIRAIEVAIDRVQARSSGNF